MNDSQAQKIARYNWLKKRTRITTDHSKKSPHRYRIWFYSKYDNFDHAITEEMRKDGR